VVTVFSGLVSKSVVTVFSGLASKLTAVVSWWSIKTKVVKGFPDLVLKTGSYNLVIWASKSPRWFIGLGFKTKQALVC
jgi:hypothetical protein